MSSQKKVALIKDAFVDPYFVYSAASGIAPQMIREKFPMLGAFIDAKDKLIKSIDSKGTVPIENFMKPDHVGNISSGFKKGKS